MRYLLEHFIKQVDKIPTNLKLKEFSMKRLIFSVSVVALLLVGCSSNSKKSEEQTVKESPKQQKVLKAEPKPTTQPKKVEKTLEQKTKEVSNKVINSAKESIDKIAKKGKELLKNAGDNEVVKSVAKQGKELVKKAKDNEVVQKISKVANSGASKVAGLLPAGMLSNSDKTDKKKSAIDAKKLYVKCAGCHGDKAQKKALGVSQVIAKWDAKKIEDALNGYKSGTYGGSMKGVMKGQANSLSDAEIKALAEYISKF